eukprot:CAMPEP_0201510158 /NCGR_PEP_ID=MMETSP0161_2-20130828/2968_1 /ASSEMBLY_ACC=CAM_ASM_000251 /TAXON_ID=180227 /ORGANISM="Neoparamoeba aestuarina, Strain SoJaBio B1-5/56/2" /LENGTH=265 /DNA_ID=CAMNT_0047905293 /DNA_START=661 /DNA_END=1458 /DNA_ORIENTATION=-
MEEESEWERVNKKRVKRRGKKEMVWGDEEEEVGRVEKKRTTTKSKQEVIWIDDEEKEEKPNKVAKSKTPTKRKEKKKEKPKPRVFGNLDRHFPPECFVEASNRTFLHHRVKISHLLYQIYNQEIFGGKLPKKMKLEWSSRLSATAGQFWSKPTRLQLSLPVLDRFSRLQSTLCHEMCHAAVELLHTSPSSRPPASHGPEWKYWTKLAMKLDPTIVITTTHSYEVDYKFTYKCRGCGEVFGRHRRIDLSRFACCYCESRLRLIKEG